MGNKTLFEMSPVEREPGLVVLTAKVTALMKKHGPFEGDTFTDEITELAGAPKVDVRLALDRIPLRIEHDGKSVKVRLK